VGDERANQLVAPRREVMGVRRATCRLAVLALAVGGFAGLAVSQDSRPSAEDISERLKARGIEVSPEQVEQGRRIIEDLRNGVEVNPERIQKIVTDVRQQLQTRALKQIKYLLGATDEEWKLLEPRVQKVQDLMLQTSPAGMGLAQFGPARAAFRAAAGESEVQ